MSTPANMIDVEQGGQQWAEIRCGIGTASRAADVMAKGKGKAESAKRRDYRAEIIFEITTGEPYPQYVSREMQWGIDQEPFARAAYGEQFDVDVDVAGFVPHPTIARFGCSPDGFVGDDGMLQIKCPTSTTHIAWMLAGKIPDDHAWQMLAELACNPERQWIDFVSYDPRLRPEHQLFVRRMLRQGNEKLIAAVEESFAKLAAEVDAQLAQMPAALPPAPEPRQLAAAPEAEPETLPHAVWCECGHISGQHGAKFPHVCACDGNYRGEICACQAFKAKAAVADPKPAAVLEMPKPAPKPIAKPAAADPKPTIDEIDPATRRPRFSDYSEYEQAKDAWLQRDTLRMFQATLEMFLAAKGGPIQ